MFDFENTKAYHMLTYHEGYYSNNPEDAGGETYCGISRRYFSHWVGWKFIDNYKKQHGEIPYNRNFPELRHDVAEFYKNNMNEWRMEKFYESGLLIPAISFWTLLGPSRSTKFLQTTLNRLYYPFDPTTQLDVDGVFGNISWKFVVAVRYELSNRPIIAMWVALVQEYLITRARERKHNIQFYEGWMNRCTDVLQVAITDTVDAHVRDSRHYAHVVE